MRFLCVCVCVACGGSDEMTTFGLRLTCVGFRIRCDSLRH